MGKDKVFVPIIRVENEDKAAEYKKLWDDILKNNSIDSNKIKTIDITISDSKKSAASDAAKQFCAERMKLFRNYFNLSQERFSEVTGLTRSVVANCESGKSTLTYSNLIESNAAFNSYIEYNNLNVKKNCFASIMIGMYGISEIFEVPKTDKYRVVAGTSMSSYTNFGDVQKKFDKQKSVMKLYNQLSSTDQAKIMERMEHIISTYEDELAIPTKRIAVLGQTACGNPIEAIAIADEFIETNELKASFALRAVGDSMSPLINDGDMILIKQTDELEVNDIGIFQINESGFSDDEEVTCKMLKSIKDGIMTLVPLNAAHDPIVVDTKKQHVKIIGKYLCRA